jgi:hypothetical protein
MGRAATKPDKVNIDAIVYRYRYNVCIKLAQSGGTVWQQSVTIRYN